jgi:hypothetical protein
MDVNPTIINDYSVPPVAIVYPHLASSMLKHFRIVLTFNIFF